MFTFLIYSIVGHFLICYLPICIYSDLSCLFMPFAHFSITRIFSHSFASMFYIIILTIIFIIKIRTLWRLQKNISVNIFAHDNEGLLFLIFAVSVVIPPNLFFLIMCILLIFFLIKSLGVLYLCLGFLKSKLQTFLLFFLLIVLYIFSLVVLLFSSNFLSWCSTHLLVSFKKQ